SPEVGRRGLPQHEVTRLVVQEPADAGQAYLERVHRERLEGPVEVETRGDRRDGDEADERQRELARDAAAEKGDERAGHDRSRSNRYPTDLTVALRLPASPTCPRGPPPSRPR